MPEIVGINDFFAYFEQVVQHGQRIWLAQLRRGWSIAELAEKAGVNRNTLTSLELGRPGTAIGVSFTVPWALGLDASLNAVSDPDNDLDDKALEASCRPTRAGKSRKQPVDDDF
jgi:transcriptional regulator with XRE-family HTH domain